MEVFHKPLPNGMYKTTIWLEQGEIVPMRCECGCIYQPPGGTMYSDCPDCPRVNDHSKQLVTLTECAPG